MQPITTLKEIVGGGGGRRLRNGEDKPHKLPCVSLPCCVCCAQLPFLPFLTTAAFPSPHSGPQLIVGKFQGDMSCVLKNS